MSNDYCYKCKTKMITCPTCKGKGTTYQGTLIDGYSDKTCPNCNGVGQLCPKCR